MTETTALVAQTASQAASDALVLDLAHVAASDLGQVGGKAANLGELIQAGFPVPAGFVLTTAAYDCVVAANELGPLIARCAAEDDGAPIREAFQQAFIPEELAQEIRAAYWRLAAPSVAVRSSATAEDLPDAAFAGQQDTFLGIVDEAALRDAVRRCWASLWSDRAMAYRRRQGFAHAAVKLAVVVQRLVAADAAGVLFTANPITGARDETVIDASTGLGEAIVSGLVTPDHIILRQHRLGWQIVARQAGKREVEIRARTGGGTEQITGSLESGPILSDAELRQLARLGAKIQRHFGRPQDVEWAWANGKLWVLQSRPITALPAPPSRRGRLGLPRGGPAEYMQIRPYPIDMTTWMPRMGQALARMLPLGKSAPSFDGMWVEEDGVVTRFAGWPEFGFKPELLLVLPRLVALAARYDPLHWREDPILAVAQAKVRALESRNLAALSWDDLLAMVQDALQIPFDAVELRRRFFPRTILALAALRLILGFAGRPGLFGQLLSGIDNKTLEANRGLESLAAIVRGDPALASIFASPESATLADALARDPAGQTFLERLNTFLAAYGHRELGSPLLISQPTWRDAPDAVLGMLKGLALTQPSVRGGLPVWEAARDEVLAHPEFQFAPLRSAFLYILREARLFPALREDTHFYMTMPMPVLRRTLLEMGRRLVELGMLATPEDVFHLRLEELEQAGRNWPPAPALVAELRAMAQQRAERRAALADTPLMDAQALPIPEPVGEALLAGTPGSPGLSEGPARIVTGPAEFGTLLPGEVLVAPYTNPSWTPLFAQAAAVVVDAGSAMSHAAIVAREYGIPAVMGTGDGTRRLGNGQRVLVDGTRGLVFPADGVAQELGALAQRTEKTPRRE